MTAVSIAACGVTSQMRPVGRFFRTHRQQARPADRGSAGFPSGRRFHSGEDFSDEVSSLSHGQSLCRLQNLQNDSDSHGMDDAP